MNLSDYLTNAFKNMFNWKAILAQILFIVINLFIILLFFGKRLLDMLNTNNPTQFLNILQNPLSLVGLFFTIILLKYFDYVMTSFVIAKIREPKAKFFKDFSISFLNGLKLYLNIIIFTLVISLTGVILLPVVFLGIPGIIIYSLYIALIVFTLLVVSYLAMIGTTVNKGQVEGIKNIFIVFRKPKLMLYNLVFILLYIVFILIIVMFRIIPFIGIVLSIIFGILIKNFSYSIANDLSKE